MPMADPLARLKTKSGVETMLETHQFLKLANSVGKETSYGSIMTTFSPSVRESRPTRRFSIDEN